MRKTSAFTTIIVFVLAVTTAGANPVLTSAKGTQVQNDGRLNEGMAACGNDLDPAPARGVPSAGRAAKIGDVVGGTRTLNTGKKSRAELLFNDNTVARLGANSVFSFKPGSRDIELKSGFLLLHTPKGKGGANIKTPSAAASVLGTTIMLSALPDGGQKLVVLEGTATITYNGVTQTAIAGQLVFLTQENGMSPPITIDLQALVSSSGMINDFGGKIGNEQLIQEAIKEQAEKIADGELEASGFKIGGDQNGLNVLNASVIEALVRQLGALEQVLAQSTAQIEEDFTGALTISPPAAIDFSLPAGTDAFGQLITGTGEGQIILNGDRFHIVEGPPFLDNQQGVDLVTFLASGKSVNYVTSFNAIRFDHFTGDFGGDVDFELVFRAQRGSIGVFNSVLDQNASMTFHAQGQGLNSGNVELFNTILNTTGEKISISSAGANTLINQSQILSAAGAGSQIQISGLRSVAIQNSVINATGSDGAKNVLIQAGQNTGRVDVIGTSIIAVKVQIIASAINLVDALIQAPVVQLGNNNNDAIVSFANTVIGTSNGQVLVNNIPITSAEGLTIQTLP